MQQTDCMCLFAIPVGITDKPIVNWLPLFTGDERTYDITPCDCHLGLRTALLGQSYSEARPFPIHTDLDAVTFNLNFPESIDNLANCSLGLSVQKRDVAPQAATSFLSTVPLSQLA